VKPRVFKLDEAWATSWCGRWAYYTNWSSAIDAAVTLDFSAAYTYYAVSFS